MSEYLLLPLDFLKFWFVDAPKEIFWYFTSLNSAFLQLFSLPLLVRTFFQPIKNEYRQGLVGFSIGMGMAVKSVLIFVDLLFLLVLLMIEAIILIAFLAWPVATIAILFQNS